MHRHIETFLDDVKASKADATLGNRKSDLKRFESYLEAEGVDVTEAEPLDVHQFLREQGEEFSDSTIKSRYASVKLLYDFLTGVADVMEESPVEDLQRSDYTGNGDSKKHQKAGIVYVTPEEKEAMAEHAPSPTLRNELLIRLLWQTGLRRGELAAVELENINREDRTIRAWAAKTEEWRTVYYQPSLDFLMEQWIDGGYRDSYAPAQESDYLLPSQRAERLTDHVVNKIVKQAAENAGIQEVLYEDASGNKRYRITAHALRHGHAVQSLKSGVPITAVRDHLGHADISQTQKYQRLIDEDVGDFYRRFDPTPDEAST